MIYEAKSAEGVHAFGRATSDDAGGRGPRPADVLRGATRGTRTPSRRHTSSRTMVFYGCTTRGAPRPGEAPRWASRSRRTTA